MKHFYLRTYILFFAVIMVWGIGWPIFKIALTHISPTWLAAVRMQLGLVCLLAYLLLTKQFQFPARADLPIIFSVGLLHMATFAWCMNAGLMHVGAGRAAILAYTTPLWVFPIATLYFKESLNWLRVLGFILGILGIIILFNPLAFDWSNHDVLLGNGLLLFAALAWGITILHIRYGTWQHSALQLAPWQMLIATVLLTALAFYQEPDIDITWNIDLILLMLFVGPLATAFAYWGAIEVSRRLPAITVSLLMLGIPVTGVIASWILLAEPLTLYNIGALSLLVTGLACIALGEQRR